jgi:hypothetical protein
VECGSDFYTICCRHSSKILDSARSFVGKSFIVVTARVREVLDIRYNIKISRKKTVLSTNVLQDLNVQLHCCENFI